MFTLYETGLLVQLDHCFFQQERNLVRKIIQSFGQMSAGQYGRSPKDISTQGPLSLWLIRHCSHNIAEIPFYSKIQQKLHFILKYSNNLLQINIAATLILLQNIAETPFYFKIQQKFHFTSNYSKNSNLVNFDQNSRSNNTQIV